MQELEIDCNLKINETDLLSVQLSVDDNNSKELPYDCLQFAGKVFNK